MLTPGTYVNQNVKWSNCVKFEGPTLKMASGMLKMRKWVTGSLCSYLMSCVLVFNNIHRYVPIYLVSKIKWFWKIFIELLPAQLMDGQAERWERRADIAIPLYVLSKDGSIIRIIIYCLYIEPVIRWLRRYSLFNPRTLNVSVHWCICSGISITQSSGIR